MTIVYKPDENEVTETKRMSKKDLLAFILKRKFNTITPSLIPDDEVWISPKSMAELLALLVE